MLEKILERILTMPGWKNCSKCSGEMKTQGRHRSCCPVCNHLSRCVEGILIVDGK